MIPGRLLSDRDWVEDFELENGSYQNDCVTCKQYFFGHKRRVVCKSCQIAAKMKKRKSVKPAFYACYLPALQAIARAMGYCLIVHGSMGRDLDLVAVPWVDDPDPELELIQAIEKHVKGDVSAGDNPYLFSVAAGGRHSYVVNILRSSELTGYEDPEYYIDISVTPLVLK